MIKYFFYFLILSLMIFAVNCTDKNNNDVIKYVVKFDTLYSYDTVYLSDNRKIDSLLNIINIIDSANYYFNIDYPDSLFNEKTIYFHQLDSFREAYYERRN